MPPNILWIVTTQWRAQSAGYAGDPNARTPAVDALAARGIRFEQAVTPHPFGPFARAAMLTGVPSPRNGVASYYDPLPEQSRTIAHRMGERGHRTAFFGKWHLSVRSPESRLVGEEHARLVVPQERRGGFGFWEGFESGFLINDPWLHGTRLPVPERFRGYQSDVVCSRAAAYLASLGAPWFAVVSLEAPHPPYGAPSGGVAPPEPERIQLRANVPGGPDQARARRELAGYYAHIQATDRAIGRLAAAVGPETIIVFTSVHGDMHGSHGLFRKGWPHEESVRVPLVIAGAGPCGPDQAALSLVDLPEITERLSEARPDLPRLAHARISMPSVVSLPDQCDRVWSGVRTPGRKLVVNADGTPWLLFDLERDPLELDNRASDPSMQAEAESLRRLVSS